ncbi:hypothetical protein DEJ46_05680 [Streptomyces venezuelae]|uniref:Uncharacterized protein n=1 Tax=Streptomyces venezuelae TaxID=54571 RepID=A0A5P2AKK0_STRVZ|nr:hypothetical protein DEJ46_05680 [Streptomyces venezuelae]
MQFASRIGGLLEVEFRKCVVDHPDGHDGLADESNAVDDEDSGIAGPFRPHRDFRPRGRRGRFYRRILRIYVQTVQERNEVTCGDRCLHIQATYELTYISIRPVLRQHASIAGTVDCHSKS